MRKVECQALQEEVHSEVLPGGLALFILPKRGFRQKSGLLAVDFGSVDLRLRLPEGREEVELPPGTAHFLEHRLFERADGDITERFSVLGAEIDASTTFTDTSFYFTCTDCFADNLELLLELVFRPEFTAAGVERERGIIAREIQLSADNLEWVSYFQALASVFPGQALATDMAGTVESIQKIDRELLVLCHRAFYRPANARLFISGDVDAGQTRDQVAAWMSRQGKEPEPFPAQPLRQFGGGTAPSPQEAFLAVVQPHLLLAFRDQRGGLTGEPLLRRELALELTLDLLFGPASSFFCEWYAAGLIDAASFGFEVNAEPSFAVCLIGGEVRRPAQLEAAIVGELEKARREGLEEADFNRARRKAYGHLLRGYDQVENCVQLMHGAVSCGAEPFAYLPAYQGLTLEDVGDCLETCLNAQGYGLSRIRPLPEGETSLG